MPECGAVHCRKVRLVHSIETEGFGVSAVEQGVAELVFHNKVLWGATYYQCLQ